MMARYKDSDIRIFLVWQTEIFYAQKYCLKKSGQILVNLSDSASMCIKVVPGSKDWYHWEGPMSKFQFPALLQMLEKIFWVWFEFSRNKERDKSSMDVLKQSRNFPVTLRLSFLQLPDQESPVQIRRIAMRLECQNGIYKGNSQLKICFIEML